MTALTLPTPRSAARRMLRGPREARVRVLLLTVVVLSAADLVLTLGFMRSIGMFEDNPLVHLLLELAGSARVEALVAYKTATVAFAVIVLDRLRHRMQGEVGAWLAVLLLASVTVQWARYADFVLDLDPAGMQCVAQADTGWVRFP